MMPGLANFVHVNPMGPLCTATWSLTKIRHGHRTDLSDDSLLSYPLNFALHPCRGHSVSFAQGIAE